MKTDMIIHETRKYKMFELHEINRQVDISRPKFRRLLAKIKKYGWESTKPMTVSVNGNGKLKIIDGHHRFVAAQMLGIPVKYSIASTAMGIHDYVETTSQWTTLNFLYSYTRQKNPNYIAVKEYHERTGIGVMNCVSILGGETAGSYNKCEQFKVGKFQLGNLSNAASIEMIVACLKENQIDFATHNNLVGAISMVVWVRDFSTDEMIKKINCHSSYLKKQPTRDYYLDMLERIYNFRLKEKIPLAFLAKSAASERKKAILMSKKKKQ